MVAVLVNVFGTEHVQMAEDVVQDALVSALETWKIKGLPENPRAWLYRTAKNKAIDIVRRNKFSQTFDFSDPEHQLLTSEYTLSRTMDQFWEEHEIKDDFLGMMFACCHPEISPENQITFILKSLCGFSTREVAKAFLTSEDTISKRLYRTKEYFRRHKVRLQIPGPKAIANRTDAVLSAIYLVFNEGYSATHKDQLIREDVISQAMLLCKSLLDNPKTQLPQSYALMALMCFHAARIEGRLTREGELILLNQQDRSCWNEELIQKGNDLLNRAAFGDSVSPYHLEAAIAYEHCTAPTYNQTNWEAILQYYNHWLSISFDPVVYLNRCLVLLEFKGPRSAWEAMNEIQDHQKMQNYYLYHAALGEILDRLGRKAEAVQFLETAAKLTQSAPEKRFLKEKIASICN